MKVKGATNLREGVCVTIFIIDEDKIPHFIFPRHALSYNGAAAIGHQAGTINDMVCCGYEGMKKMKTKTDFKKGSRIAGSTYSVTIKNLVFSALILTGIRAPLQAQVKMAKADVLEPEVRFYITSPSNIPVEPSVKETFPIRNYVFFNIGSTKIPDRYVLLSKDQSKYFKEGELDLTTSENGSARSVRERIVHYNVLNILGDRMGRSPSTTVTLVGTSAKSPEDGWVMANPIKGYLVNVFGIDGARIIVAGRYKPIISSKQPGTNEQLLREEARKVFIESSSPALLEEFQGGPDATPKQVEIMDRQEDEAPFDSYLSFNVVGGKAAFSSWSLELSDEKGKTHYFGPYTQENVNIPGKSILGTRPEGDYKATMIGQTKSGKTVKKETSVHIVRWTPPKNEQGMRFSVLFGLNEWRAIPAYEKYLTDIVAPKIPKGGTVIIHGYPDSIDGEARNQKLSLARANDVVTIIEGSLLKADRSDVTFEVFPFGEDENVLPIENKFPEERFNNRTVVIDVIPR